MQYVIWLLLVIFCLIPPLVARILLKHNEVDEEFKKWGGGKK